MIASVTGINFYNKGAELMGYAVSREFASWGKDFIPSAHLGIGTFAERRAAGLRSHVWMTNRQRDKLPGAAAVLGAAGNVLPRPLRERYDLVSDRDVDVILDGSGFAFSDQWGPGKAEKMAALCQRWKESGKKVVLLPQAFGPFSTDRTSDATKAIVGYADLVFARDAISLSQLQMLVGDISKLKLAPDFTNLLEPVPSQNASGLAGRTCVIPNTRMIDKTAGETGSVYLDFLTHVISASAADGDSPFLLVHEKTDHPLAERLRHLVSERLGIEVDVVSRSSSLELKAILGASKIVVGSRFHGLVSALSQAVPCIATGWSHKYEELFRDYGVGEYVVPVTAGAEDALSLLARLNSPNQYAAIRQILIEKSKVQKAGARAMWADVRATIG